MNRAEVVATLVLQRSKKYLGDDAGELLQQSTVSYEYDARAPDREDEMKLGSLANSEHALRQRNRRSQFDQTCWTRPRIDDGFGGLRRDADVHGLQ